MPILQTKKTAAANAITTPTWKPLMMSLFAFNSRLGNKFFAMIFNI